HYPAIKPELVELTSALHDLAHDAEKRAEYMANAPAFADRFQLPPDQREALIKLDLPAIVKMGAHPLVPFLAQLQIQRPAAQSGCCGLPCRQIPWRDFALAGHDMHLSPQSPAAAEKGLVLFMQGREMNCRAFNPPGSSQGILRYFGGSGGDWVVSGVAALVSWWTSMLMPMAPR